MLKMGVVVFWRCNGMGEFDCMGSYVKLVYHDVFENRYFMIFEGQVENLIGQIGGVFAQCEDAVLESIMRDVRDV